MSKLRFHNRFIYVGVDITIHALLTGDGVHTPLSRLVLYPRFSVSVVVCVWITLGTVMCCLGQE